MTVRLRPTNPAAPEAVLVGDPGRALMLAQELLIEPKMSNHARGLWGYTANGSGGSPLTVQTTGMGGPSAAAVLADLARLGLRRAVRVGTCRALRADLEPGTVVAISGAVGADGASRALTGAAPAAEAPRLACDPSLAAAIADAGDAGSAEREQGKPTPDDPVATANRVPTAEWVVSLDLDPARMDGQLPVHSAVEEGAEGDRAAGCGVCDMQTAALLAAGSRAGVSLAAILVVEWSAEGDRLEPEQLDAAVKSAGDAAAAALDSTRDHR